MGFLLPDTNQVTNDIFYVIWLILFPKLPSKIFEDSNYAFQPATMLTECISIRTLYVNIMT